MITGVNNNDPTTATGIIKKKDYKDPLNSWYMKSLSYSNELGTAIMEVAPKLGAALWAPTFMYIGADIYDKYKNDKDEFNPSKRRGFERAIYQGITNLLVAPLIIFGGQKIISPISKLSKDGISSNAKDALFSHTRDVISQSPAESLNDMNKFLEIVKTSLENKITARKTEQTTNNFFKKTIRNIRGHYVLAQTDKNKLMEFTDKNIEQIFKIKDSLTNKTQLKNINSNIYKEYNKILPKMIEMYGDDYYKEALKGGLKEYQNSLIFKNKLLKTAGGFVALLTLANPINKLIQNHFIEKYIDPGLQSIPTDFINNFYMKNMFMDKSSVKKQITETISPQILKQ